MGSKISWECVDEMGSYAPRISLSEGLVFRDSDLADNLDSEARKGSPYSSEFEFLMASVADSCEVGCSPLHSTSMSSADRLFCNGKILPLDQAHLSQPSCPQESTVSDHVTSKVSQDNGRQGSISRHLRDVFNLKRSTHQNSVSDRGAADTTYKDKLRALWFLGRSRSTNENKRAGGSVQPNVDPWLGRSASDSRINHFQMSRHSYAKFPSRAASVDNRYDSFRSYVDSLSQSQSNSKARLGSILEMAAVPKCKVKAIRMSSPGIKSCGSGGKRRASASPGTRSPNDGVAAMGVVDHSMPHKSSHPSRARRRQQYTDQGAEITHKAKELSRSTPRSHTPHEHWRSRRSDSRGSAAPYQVAPVLHVQMCMGESSCILPRVHKARFVNVYNLSFMKKDRMQKQNASAAATAAMNHVS